MPAIKVKSRPTMEGVGQSLHSCCKSGKTSKGSRLQVKATQTEAVLDTFIQDSFDVTSNVKEFDRVVNSNEACDYQDLFAGDSIELSKLPPSLLCDSMLNGRTGLETITSPSILQTIFSPILMPEDSEFKMIGINNSVRDAEQPALPLLVADESDDGSCHSRDLQTCSVSDFFICEGANALTFDGELTFADVMDVTCPYYEQINDDILLDTSEKYMKLPFLESTIETTNTHDGTCIEDAVVDSDDAYLYLAIHQLKSSDQEGLAYHSGDLAETECFDPQLIFKNLPDLPEAVSSIRPILLPNETQKKKSITLVLDLDETLVHSTLEPCEDADFSFPVFFNLKQHMVYVKRRPYLQIFLERVAQMFEIIVFTASQSIYAEQLLDILDPDKMLIGRRIYRESCIFSDGSYTKDLTVLGIDLAKVAIIDNSPQVFRLQVNNGIPIMSWFDDPSDHALLSLLPFLETLVDADDVRPIIA
ncbi:uncharacterized protein LOC120258796 [Dioscorea cayenensis subsp. rotundata]|uniref:Uncharacterized protein LOC120258796 n=1 Tax=Dioscorea cayennensis subsp. rotundata TaxID=55577 RepID=A0AB40B4U1_DIOCR|nr:uncharacterized protein LOC120258796 [Dioscorea cayenensis subsp. rotundata]